MRSFHVSPTSASRCGALLVAVLVGAGTARAQTADPRWQPWLGCWNATDAHSTSPGAAADGMVCVVPATAGPGVDVVVIDHGKVAHRDALDASGQRVPKTVENCPGWESAAWSVDDRRVLSRMEYQCGKVAMKGSNIFAMSTEGDWIEVRGTQVGASSTVRVVRYSPAGVSLAPATGAARSDSMPYIIVPQRGVNSRYSRLAAGEPVQPDAVLDVAEHVDLPVAEAWLNELRQPFALSGKELVRLADSGMPPKIIDLMVALSYPERFAVRRTGPGERTVNVVGTSGSAYDLGPARRFGNAWDCGYEYLPMTYGYALDDCYLGYSRYGYMYGQRYGYGYGPGYYYPGYNYGGYYWGQQPIVIVRASAAQPEPQRGQAVNGAGYTRRPGGTTTTEPVRTRGSTRDAGSGGTYAPTSSSGSATASPSGTTSGSTSGGDDGRTAKPRVPPM